DKLVAFGDQAALAVSNAQLFNDLDAALARQTAMTDVLDAVSVARTDPAAVFAKIAEHAFQLVAGMANALVFVRDGDDLVTVGASGPRGAEWMQQNPTIPLE